MTLLLAYQQQLLRLLDQYKVVVCEKSRRIGMTWTAAAYAVLLAARQRAAGGMDVLYIGYNLDMTHEFMATVRNWLRAFAAGNVRLHSGIKESSSRIEFDSGFFVKALSAHPRSLRGRQGLVIIDEAAYHDDLNGLIKAAMALQIWGGRVLVISTHHGQDNDFCQLVNAVVAGKLRYGHLRVTFDQAIRQGLYERIHDLPVPAEQRQKLTPAIRNWARTIRQDYAEAAAEELDCLPAQTQAHYFNMDSLWRCTQQRPAKQKPIVLRWRDKGTQDETAQWCSSVLDPALASLAQDCPHDPYVVGVDFGRHHDLSVFFVLSVDAQLCRYSRLVIELANTPFAAQSVILQRVLGALPNLHRVMMDKGGNGGYLHEQMEQNFGSALIKGIQISRDWYGRWMPALRATIDQGLLILPHDRDIIHDLGQIAFVDGVPKPLPRRQGRHADAAIALTLAFQATHLPAPMIEANVGSQRLFTEEASFF